MMWIQTCFVVAALTVTGGQMPSAQDEALNLNPVVQAHHGIAKGHWRLPDTAGPGAMVGRFFTPNGVAVLEVHAQVLDPLPGEPAGKIHGIVSTLQGPNPHPIGELRGLWRPTTGEMGEFKAHIVRPDPNGGPCELIGGLKGQFIDPQGPLPPGGLWHGHWVLNP